MSGKVEKSFYNYQVRLLAAFTILSLSIFLIIIYATLSRYFDRDFRKNLENQGAVIGRQLQEHLEFLQGQLGKYSLDPVFISNLRNNHRAARERVEALFPDSPEAVVYLGLFQQHDFLPSPPAGLNGFLDQAAEPDHPPGSPNYIIRAGPENEIFVIFKIPIDKKEDPPWLVMVNNLSLDGQFGKYPSPEEDLYLRTGEKLISLKKRTALPLPPVKNVIYKKGYPEMDADWPLTEGLAPVDLWPGLFIKAPTEPLVQKKSSIFLWMFFISCSVLFMSLVVTVLISRAVSEPLKNLVRQTAHIAEDPQGKTLLESELEYKEFAGLARAFNQVLNSLEDARRRLEKRASEELDLSRRKYSDLVENVTDYIFTHDLTGVFSYVNRAVSRELGYDKEAIVGLNVREIVVEKYQDDIGNYLNDVIGAGRAEGIMTLYDASGCVHHLAYRSILIQQEDLGPHIFGVANDITAKLLAERALKESESKYRSVVETSLSGICLIQEEKFVYVNPRLVEMLGYDRPESLLGEDFIDFVFPADRDQVIRKRVFKEMDPDSTRVHSFRLLSRENRALHVEVRGARLHYMGRPANVGNIIDIDDRVRAEQALLESKKTAEGLLEGVPVPSFVLDRNHRIIYWNRAMEELTGRSREEMIGGQNAWEIFYPHPRPLLADLILDKRNDLIQQYYGSKRIRPFPLIKNALEFEDLFQRLAGKPRQLYVLAAPIHDEQGEVVAVMETIQDTSSLIRLELYLFHILNAMPSALAATDESGQVTLWNEAMAKSAGVTRDEATGRDLCKLLAPFHLEGLPEKFNLALKGKNQNLGRLPVKSPLGKQYYWEIILYSLGDGPVKGVIFRADDVTRRVKMDEMMIQTEKMVSLGTLAAGVAHEINNPLAGILQGAQMARRRLDKSLPATRQLMNDFSLTPEETDKLDKYLTGSKVFNFLDGINESGRRAGRIVRDLLEFSRKQDLNITPHQLHGVMEQALNLALTDYDLKKKYDIKNIRLTKEFSPEIDLVPCDPQQIQQVVLNLVRNAAEAAVDDDPARRGREPSIRIKTSRENRFVKIEVTDNGPGIPESLRERVFEPFFTTKPVGKGTGLGLYISYGIIRKHGGTMEYYKNQNGESCFVFTIPLTAEDGPKII